MTEWISVTINILLLIITVSTVVYASKTLLMEYSSQVIVSRIVTSSNLRDYYIFSWEVEVQNVGKGYIVKAFMLLSMPSKTSRWRKQYFLSKPIVGLKPDESRLLRLTLKDKHIEKTSREKEKVEILYQDAMNNIYIVTPGMLDSKNPQQHLQSFNVLPKKLSKFWIKFWRYKRKINKAVEQGNSYPERLFEETKIKKEKHDELLKNFKFEPIDNKDTE